MELPTDMERNQIKDVEEAVVCALLVRQQRLPEVIQWLRADMFATPELGFIYSAIIAQYEEGEKPDMLTTDTRMRRMDGAKYEAMKGIHYISAAMLSIRHAGNLTVYAAEVKRQYLLRTLRTLFAGLQGKVSEAEADCEEVINETEKALFDIREQLQRGNKSLRPIAGVAADTLAYHLKRMESAGDMRNVQTGIHEFDRITGGMQPGELFVAAGRPGDGKSAVAIQIAVNAAKAGKKVCFFSLEMTEVQIMNRLYAGYGPVDDYHLRVSDLNTDELKRMQTLTDNWRELPFFLDYTAANSRENIRAQVMLQQNKSGCDLIVVDYLHLMETGQRKGEILEQAIARNVRAMKYLAKETGCPLLLISQMNRNSENRAHRMHLPQLSDLRDSGTIEQVADCVFFIYRPERYGILVDESTGQSLKGVGKLIIAKNRNGAVGTAAFRHNDTFSLITN